MRERGNTGEGKDAGDAGNERGGGKDTGDGDARVGEV